MAKRFTFTSTDFTAKEQKDFTREMGTGMKLDLLATKPAIYAAQNKLSDLATRMMIESKRPWEQCLEFVMADKANAVTVRVSQMMPADRRDANVDVDGPGDDE